MYLLKDGAQYTFPTYSALNGISLASRNSATSKIFQHGGLNTADKKINYREIEIGIFINGSNQADYLSQVDTLKKNLMRSGQKLYITDTRYINIDSMSSLDEKFYDGFYLVKAELTATLMALDPFFYTASQQQTINITATGQQFTINNPGNIDTAMDISITAIDILSSISLKNVTDNGRLMVYSDANFTAGKTLVISNVDGTVLLNGNSTINDFSGAFLSLLSGDNIFTWTGGACTIQINYPVRWL